ncbi:MAG: hypothetical protein KF752_14745 [Pirellulaceae bacterium]|nr:hypothetical protein [Pirellulaceae bacterium]
MSPAKPGAQEVDWKSVLGSDQLGLDGVELEQFCQSLIQHSRRGLRLRDDSSVIVLPFEVQPVPWYQRGRWVANDAIRPGAFLHHAAGDYYLQDAASMLALALCQVQPGQLVCDLCAAPGGKATGLLEQLEGRGLLVANEVIGSRLPVLQHALYRTGWANHVTTSSDVERLSSHCWQMFDCVLVDAPCTGQSLVGRDRQSWSAFSKLQIEHSAARQWRILHAASKLVRPGGRLVYSTCTFSVAENEQLIERFLNHESHWEMLATPELAQWSSPRLPGSYRLWPHRDHCDGGFAAALQRPRGQDDPPAIDNDSSMGARKRWQGWRGKLSQLPFWLPNDSVDDFDLRQQGKVIHLVSKLFPARCSAILESGVPMFELRRAVAEPCYASSVLNSALLQPVQQVVLYDTQAIRYFAGESVSVEAANIKAQVAEAGGWCQVQWQGRAVAWGKLVAGTLKNHLPKSLRQNNLIAAQSRTRCI